MPEADYLAPYKATLEALIRQHGREVAIDLIVGGKYDSIGRLEADALRCLGMKVTDTIVDVGCGSGRLAAAIAENHVGQYFGTDILAEALEHAAARVKRRDWSFVKTEDTVIPLPADTADFVIFFSVFTHLHDEDIYRFLREAKRVCRVSGSIVFSYLDFDVPSHWPVFQQSVANTASTKVLTKFISRGAIRYWCQHLGLSIVQLYDGNEKWIRNGLEDSSPQEFGQSVAVLRRV